MNEREIQAKELGLGLISTSPFYINDTTLYDLGNSPGYIILALEEIIFDAASELKVQGSSITGEILPQGYYHIVAKKIQLASGRCIVYRTNK